MPATVPVGAGRGMVTRTIGSMQRPIVALDGGGLPAAGGRSPLDDLVLAAGRSSDVARRARSRLCFSGTAPTLVLFAGWRAHRVDGVLRDAHAPGLVLAGGHRVPSDESGGVVETAPDAQVLSGTAL